MPFVPTANTAQIDTVYNWSGQIVENVFHYEHPSGAPTLADLTALTDAVREYISTNLVPLMADTITLLRVVGKLIDVADGLFFVSTTGLPQAGGGGSPALPNNVSAAYSWRTSAAGRSFRGRSFVVGLQEGHVVENNLTTAAANAFGTALHGLAGVAADDGWEMVIVSKFSGGAPRAAGVTTPVTASFFTNTVIDSQRRRLPGRGS